MLKTLLFFLIAFLLFTGCGCNNINTSNFVSSKVNNYDVKANDSNALKQVGMMFGLKSSDSLNKNHNIVEIKNKEDIFKGQVIIGSKFSSDMNYGLMFF